MKKLWLAVLIFSVSAPLCQAQDNLARRIYFQQSGFSITVLETQEKAMAYTVLAMFLPPFAKFAPNVNVAIQPFEGSIHDYAQLTRKQFRAGNFRVLEERFAPDAVVWEYAGKMGDLPLHWYAKAVYRQGLIYLVAATVAENQWAALAAKMKRCVDSFRLEK